MVGRKTGTKKGTGTKRKAGKASNGPEDAFHQAFYDDSSSDDNGTFDESLNLNAKGELWRKAKRKPKRPRVAAPEPILISDSEGEKRAPPAKPMYLDEAKIVQVVYGPDGPTISLDFTDKRNCLVNLNEVLDKADLEVVPMWSRLKKAPAKYKGFVDLPVEIAVKIYRHLFVANAPIMFSKRDNFSRSSQFLRVCKKARDEGTAILYGENAFHFSRIHERRGKYFEADWGEIGYKDVRRFLSDIGDKNVASLKYVSIELEDALPSTTNLNFGARRYINDAILLEVLDKLASHATLNKFVVGFRGSRGLTERDYHLLKVMAKIKCFELYLSRHGVQRIKEALFVSLKHLMILPTNPNVVPSRVSKKFVPQVHGQPSEADA